MFLKANAQQGEKPTISCQVATKMRTPVYAACAAAVLAILILLGLSPPFVQRRNQNEIERGQLEIMRLLGWGLVVFAVVLLVPLFL